MFCIITNMPSMSGGKSAIQYVPQKVHTFSTRVKVSFVKLYGSLTSQTAYRRGDKIDYTCHQFEIKRLTFFTRTMRFIFWEKKKKELLEKQWTVIFSIASFKLLVYAHVEVNWHNKCHFQGLVFGWPCVDIFAQEYGKNFSSRQTAHAQAKYQS